MICPRVRPEKGKTRARRIDFRHVVDSLAKKSSGAVMPLPLNCEKFSRLKRLEMEKEILKQAAVLMTTSPASCHANHTTAASTSDN